MSHHWLAWQQCWRKGGKQREKMNHSSANVSLAPSVVVVDKHSPIIFLLKES